MQRQSFGESLGAELQLPLTRCRNGVEERFARGRSVHARAMNGNRSLIPRGDWGSTNLRLQCFFSGAIVDHSRVWSYPGLVDIPILG